MTAERAVLGLDHAATTPLRPEARAAMLDAWDADLGNASGTHGAAQRAKNALEAARERAAEILGLERPLGIVFTSGGTESDNLAVAGVARRHRTGSVVVSSIEHKAVLEAAHALEAGPLEVREAAADRDGVVTPDAVAASIDAGTVLVSVMAANNELGTMQPVADIAGVARADAPDAVVHTDAVQAYVGRTLDVGAMGVDLLTLSAHKFGGPQGVGLLAVRDAVRMDPITHGGGQEAGRRPGTSNVAGILGMVAAMEAAEADRTRFAEVVGGERDAFEGALAERLPQVEITGSDAERLPHVSHVRFPGVRSETLLIHLDRHGIHAAAGSACQSGAVEPSHVLAAIGMDELAARECVRFSFGWTTPHDSGASAAAAVADIVERISPRVGVES